MISYYYEAIMKQMLLNNKTLVTDSTLLHICITHEHRENISSTFSSKSKAFASESSRNNYESFYLIPFVRL